MSRDGWAALHRGATGLSAVCDCGISRSYSLTIFVSVLWSHSLLAMGWTAVCDCGHILFSVYLARQYNYFCSENVHCFYVCCIYSSVFSNKIVS